MNNNQQRELAAITGQYAIREGTNETLIANLRCLKFSLSNMRMPDIFDPSICVIVQGSKDVLLENDIYHYSPSEFLAVSVDLPFVGLVTEASPDKPYLCLQVIIDRQQMSDLVMQPRNESLLEGHSARGIFVGKVNNATLDAFLRLARLLNTPEDIPTLAPMIMREIHYRILNGDYGPSIAQMAIPGSHIQQIARVIAHMRADIAQPIRIRDLADLVNMSESSLYYHFKAVTAMSPLQYCKRLRLIEARKMMLAEGVDASAAAYRVGYSSPSQFNREYARLFGVPPMKDIKSIRSIR